MIRRNWSASPTGERAADRGGAEGRPQETPADLIAQLRKDPDKFSYASSGNGGLIHLAGFKFSINTWYVAQVPAATPQPVIDKFNTAFNKALALPEVMKRMGELAIEPIQSTPQQAKAFFDGQTAFWDPIVKASGAKAE